MPKDTIMTEAEDRLGHAMTGLASANGYAAAAGSPYRQMTSSQRLQMTSLLKTVSLGARIRMSDA